MNSTNEKESDSGPLRLVKYLAASGIASRRKAAELVKNGEVLVNGQLPEGPWDMIGPTDIVTWQGKKITLDTLYYLVINKPRGYTCTNLDKHAEKKVFELIDLPGNPKIFSAGRLDRESEGMLIITNDGDYCAKLSHPRYEILKTYLVTVNPPIPAVQLDVLRKGIMDDGEFLKPYRLEEIKPGYYRFLLNEGKKREIRRLVQAAGSKTVKLVRVQIGALRLGDLPTGKWRFLTEQEIAESLKKGICR